MYLFVTFSVYLSDTKYLKLWKIQNANVQTVNVRYAIVEIAKKATVLVSNVNAKNAVAVTKLKVSGC